MKKRLFLGLGALMIGLAALAVVRGLYPSSSSNPTPVSPPIARIGLTNAESPTQAVVSVEPVFAAKSNSTIGPEEGRSVTDTAPNHHELDLEPRELVAKLAQFGAGSGPLTREKADQWKHSLQQLAGSGEDGVSAIREYLERNEDLNFAALPGGNLLGQSSLRTGLLHALEQMEGADAQALMYQTLQTTCIPGEIALVARYLEQQAPGQYSQEVMSAVNEVLAMASKGQLAGADVGPLFEVLQSNGGGGNVATIENLGTQWNYYSAIALAGLPDGEGISALIRRVESPSGEQRSQVDLAFQMLAQVAAQYPDAGAALIQQAQKGQLNDSVWGKIASGLAGDQFTLSQPSAGGPVAIGSTPGLKSFHIGEGNQSFYGIPFSALTTPEEATQRLNLIDQLMAGNLKPGAMQALQTARDRLSGLAAGPK